MISLNGVPLCFLRLLSILIFLCGSPVFAEDLPSEDKFAELLKSAEQGVAEAQFNLGICYGNGDGVPKDDAVAAEWFRNAAEQGHVGGQWALSRCYGEGLGVIKDDAESLKWLKKAAENGHGMSQNNLAALYAGGVGGVTKDEKLAIKWTRKAAEQGVAVGQYILGAHYFAGEGVPKNIVTAYMWLSLSSEGGLKRADEALQIVGSKMTSGQISEAKLLIRNWKSKK